MRFKKLSVSVALTLMALFMFTGAAGAVGSISGQVKLEHEFALLPVPGAAVSAISQSNHLMAMAMTDSNGQYQINNLQAGNYKVVACQKDLGCLFYPGTINPDSAGLVAVLDGQVTSGIDLTFRPFVPPPPNPGLITGVITDAKTGLGLPGALVVAKGQFLAVIFQTLTGPNGIYSLPVPAGSYMVGAAAKGYMPAEFPGNPVSVNAYDTIPNVNIALPPMAFGFGSVSGQVANAADSLPLPHALVVARQRDGFGFGAALSDSTGHYHIGPLPAGFYKVAALARGFFPAVYPDSVPVQAGQDTPNINFHLHPVPPPDLGTISGLVTDDSTGAPIGCVVVAAVGFDSVFHHRIVRFAQTDSTGNYVIGGLPKLPYFVIAWARGYLAEIYNNVHRFADATPVTPDAVGINFALARRDTSAHSLAGIVTSGGGIPEAGALVSVSAGGSVIGSALSLPDGGFIVDGLPSGSYIAWASTQGADGSLQNADLTGGSLAGVNLTLPASTGLRGDINGDGVYSPADAVALLNAVFLNQTVPDPAAADLNCDGVLTPSDAVTELNLVFLGRSAMVCGF